MAGKRQFGNIRPLPSGRFQTRFTAPDGVIVKAPTTFESKKRANDWLDWLAIQHADLLSGRWHDPNLGAVTLSEYAEQWFEDKDDIEASTIREQSARPRTFPARPPGNWVVFLPEGGDRARLWSVLENHGEVSNDGLVRTFELSSTDLLADLRHRLVSGWR